MFRLYGYITDSQLNPIEGVKMTVTPSGGPNILDNIIIGENPIIGISDLDGYVYVDLVGSGVPFRAKINNTGFDRYFISPNSGYVDITTLV